MRVPGIFFSVGCELLVVGLPGRGDDGSGLGSDFFRIPGGHKHWSAGDKKEGALFYEESSGKFDLIPVK